MRLGGKLLKAYPGSAICKVICMNACSAAAFPAYVAAPSVAAYLTAAAIVASVNLPSVSLWAVALPGP